MTHRCLLTILCYLIRSSLLGLIHRIWIPQRCFWRHHHSLFLSSTNNQQPCGLFFYSFCITRWSGGFLKSYCRFCCNFFYVSPTFWRSVNILSALVLFSLEELAIFFHFFSSEFNSKIFSSDSAFSCVFLPFRSVFQNQRISFFAYLNSIFENIDVARYSHWLVFFR